LASRVLIAPACAAALSLAGVVADVTSAARPPQRARLTMGVTAWFLRSNVPPRRDNTSRSDRVRTFPDKALSSCRRNAFGCSSTIRRYAEGTVCSAASPHTTRPSISSEDKINPRSRSGSSSQPCAAANQSDCEREKFALNAMAPLRSEGSPQPSRISCVRVAMARSRELAAERPSRHDSALSTSEDGIASRRATLPSVSHAKPSPGACSASARASSSALRTRLSTTTDTIALVADAFVPLRNRSPAMPVTRWPTVCSSVASAAKPIERRSMKL
jgi:hypothetical protein